MGERRWPTRYWSDEELHAAVRVRVRERKRRKHGYAPADGPMAGSAWRTGNYVMGAGWDPPDEVVVEAERARTYERTLTETLMGDPPPWRSALGRRGQ
jgi:hypothetical protein